MGYPQLGLGYPQHRTAEQTLATRWVICLLHSHRMTFSLPTAYILWDGRLVSLCLSGGYPSQVQPMGVPSQVQLGGTSARSSKEGTPARYLGNLPPPSQVRTRGEGSPAGGYPGYPLAGYPGYPPCRIPPGQESTRSTWYAAVGMPLAFTQEDFLVMG